MGRVSFGVVGITLWITSGILPMKPGTKRPFPESLFPTLSSQRPGEQESRDYCTSVEEKTNQVWAFEIAPTDSRPCLFPSLFWESKSMMVSMAATHLGLLPSTDFTSQVRENSDPHQGGYYSYIIREFPPQLNAGWTSPSYSS